MSNPNRRRRKMRSAIAQSEAKKIRCQKCGKRFVPRATATASQVQYVISPTSIAGKDLLSRFCGACVIELVTTWRRAT